MSHTQLKQDRAFGDIRALLQRPASVKAWATLCKLCGVIEPQRWEQELRPYITGHLRAWPDHLRVTPKPWVKKMARGQDVPHASICAHLDLSGRDVTARSIEHLEDSSLDPSILRVLTLENTWSTPQNLERLYTSPLLAHIEHASLSVEEALDTSDIYASTSEMDARAVKTTFHRLAGHLPLKTFVGLQTYADFADATYLQGAHTQKLEALHLKLQHNAVSQDILHANLPNLRALGLGLYQGWYASALTQQKLEPLLRAPWIPQVRELYLTSFAPQLWDVLKRAPWGALEHVYLVHFSRDSTDDTQGFETMDTRHLDATRAFSSNARVHTLEAIQPSLTWPALRAKARQLHA